MKAKILLATLVLAFIPVSASATAILRSGDTVSVTNDQVINGDFYAGGGVVSLSGVVKGDMYTAAGSFTNNGIVDGDLSVAGGSVQMHASVTDDVRVIGGEVVVAGSVGGDVVVVGGLLKVLSTAQIDGDILFFGGDLQVLGPVEGSIMGMADQVRVDSHVGGSIDVTATRVSLGDRTEVLGDVRYVSNNELVRSQSAVIVGEVVQNTAPVETEVSYENIIISFIVMLFSALMLQLIFRNQLTRQLPKLTDGLGMAGLIGIATLILAPIVIVIALASMLGTLIGLLLLAGFILLLLLTFALSSVYLGAIIGKFTNAPHMPHVLYTVFGAVIIQLLLLIPLIGQTLALVLYFIVFGAIVRSLFLFFRQ